MFSKLQKVHLIAITYHMQALKIRGIYHPKQPDLMKVRYKAKAAAQTKNQFKKENNNQTLNQAMPSSHQ